jgi:putative ABC transport system substrate-binding protein
MMRTSSLAGQQMELNLLNRRVFITLLGGALSGAPSAAHAEGQATKVSKLGLLWPGDSSPAPPRMESFRRGLREQGYVDGRNVSVELRFAREGMQTLPRLAAELVQMNVDVICAFGDLAPKLAQEATRKTPIIAITDDIVGAGLVANLSHPGGNLTGLTILSPELSAKRLQMLKSMFPSVTRVAALTDPTTGTAQVLLTSNAAQFLNVDLQVTASAGPRRSACSIRSGEGGARGSAQRLRIAVAVFPISRDNRLGG